MILFLIFVLFGFGDCSSAGGIGGKRSGATDILKKNGIKPENSYINNQPYDQKDDGVNYEDGFQEYVDDRKDYRGDNRDDNDRQKYDKYEGPEEYVTSYKSDRDNRDRYYEDEYRNNDDKDCYDKDGKRLSTEKCRKSDLRSDYDGHYDDDERDCYDSNGKLFSSDRCRSYNRQRYCDNDFRYYDDTNCFKDGTRFYDNETCQYEDSRDQYYDRCYGDVNLVGLGRNDSEDQLIRPCALEDWQCIRHYFARNSKCKVAYGPIPDPLYIKRSTAYFPLANLTVIITRLRLTGLGSIKISEFYINKDTGNLVISLDFRKLNETSPRVYFRYKRTAKESIVLSDYATVEFSSGTFTAVIPKVPHLRLDLAEIHADIDSSAPPFFIGPRAVNSADPDVQTSFATLLANLPTAVQEGLLFQAQLFTAIYIQENICDFGLKLISI